MYNLYIHDGRGGPARKLVYIRYIGNPKGRLGRYYPWTFVVLSLVYTKIKNKIKAPKSMCVYRHHLFYDKAIMLPIVVTSRKVTSLCVLPSLSIVSIREERISIYGNTFSSISPLPHLPTIAQSQLFSHLFLSLQK